MGVGCLVATRCDISLRAWHADAWSICALPQIHQAVAPKPAADAAEAKPKAPAPAAKPKAVLTSKPLAAAAPAVPAPAAGTTAAPAKKPIAAKPKSAAAAPSEGAATAAAPAPGKAPKAPKKAAEDKCPRAKPAFMFFCDVKRVEIKGVRSYFHRGD